MAWTAPTTTELKARFPRFEAGTEPQLQGAIDEALLITGPNWPDAERTLGTMLYAAHVLTLDGVGTGTEAQLNAEGVGDFQSIKLGSLSLSRFSKDASSSRGSAVLDDLMKSTFGQRFYALAARFAGGPITTGDPSALNGISPNARDVPRLPGFASRWPGNG